MMWFVIIMIKNPKIDPESHGASIRMFSSSTVTSTCVYLFHQLGGAGTVQAASMHSVDSVVQ